MDIKKIFQLPEDQKIDFHGWIRFKREMKDIIFIELFDGTNLNGIQVIVKKSDVSDSDYQLLKEASVFTAVHIEGITKLNKRQNTLEIQLIRVIDFALSNESNPLQKKNHSMEFLREIAHLRPRTKTFQSVFKIRSLVMAAFHEFFQKNDFIYVHSPIITSNDAEGAGETFKVVDGKNNNFFANENDVSLSVSGQLHAEAFAQAFKKVYTLAPTFRAENSNTQKHAAEFWMLEPEIAFADYFEIMDLSADMLQYVSQKIATEAKEEIEFLSKINEVDLNRRLQILINKKIKKLRYEEAIEILKENKEKFEVKDIEFGFDLGTEHEKFLADSFGDYIVIIYDYPKDIKSFYMKRNDDNKTVRGFDLIIPEIGEMIGGSERENDYEKLMEAVKEKNIDSKELDWYLMLRQYGYLKSTGFGLGTERFIMYITGIKNIRDVLPYPRTPGVINF